MYLRKGDEVIVIAGKDKGQTGTVKEILPNNKIIVEGIALVKKHKRVMRVLMEQSLRLNVQLMRQTLIYMIKTKQASRVKFEVKEEKDKRVKFVN